MYLISYDIRDDKRRSKVANTLLDYCRRVQYSVFEYSGPEKSLLEILSKLSKIIDKNEDNLRCYPLCLVCSEKIKVVGQEKSISIFDEVIII